MITSAQSQVFNKLMSDSRSHFASVEGDDVAVLIAEGEIDAALLANGFKQEIKRDRKFGDSYGHCSWWNEAQKVLVSNVPRSRKWSATFVSADGRDTHVLSGGDLAPIALQAAA